MKVLNGIASFIVGFIGATGKVIATILAIIGMLLVVAIGGSEGVKAVAIVAAVYVALKLIRIVLKKK